MAGAVPQTFWLYGVIWNDLVSDSLYRYIEDCSLWICTLTALDCAAMTALGYIMYNSKHLEGSDLHKALFKKRVAY